MLYVMGGEECPVEVELCLIKAFVMTQIYLQALAKTQDADFQ